MKTSFALLLAIIAFNVYAQDPMIEWENDIGGTGSDILSSIQQTADGGYIIGGTSKSNISSDKTENSMGGSDYWVVKMSASGNIQWQNTIGGSFTDELMSIRQTSDGGYIVGGHSDSGISGDKTESNLGFDFWILKLDATGNIQWQKTLGGLGDQELTTLEIAADGGYILHQGSGLLPELIMKIDSNGNLVHQVNLSRGGIVQETPDGKYMVGTGFPSSFGSEIRLQKVDINTAVLWNREFTANGNDQLRAFQQLPDGGYILGARSSSNIWGDKTENNRGPSNTYDYWVIRLDAARNIVWDKTIGGSGDEDLSYIQQTSDGGFIIGGFSNSDSSGDKNENAIVNPANDLWIVKIDALGNIIWQNTIGGSSHDYLNSMDITAAGGYILGSKSQSNASGDKSENSQGSDDYWIVKLRAGLFSNRITGRVYADLNSNCLPDASDAVYENSLLRVEPSQTYFTTGDSGKYELWVDTGYYSVSVLPRNPYFSVYCPASGTFPVNFTSQGNISSNNNFGLRADIHCPLLKVDIATARLRACTNTLFAVQYANMGTLPSFNAYITIDFGDYVQPHSSTMPWTSVSGNVYTFPLGTLNVNQRGSFRVTAVVSCDAIVNSTQCVTAQIYPDTLCGSPSAGWDKSEIAVSGTCVNDSLICFTIKNLSGAGIGNMSGAAEWRLYANDSLVTQGTYQLAGRDSLIQCHPANGKTYRLEANQRPGHPRQSHPRAIVEACGTPKNFGFVNTITQDDADLYVETFCMLVTASLDPNDKQVFPTGITPNKYIKPDDELEYLIRFQNTGNDTAFKVVIRDTIQTDVIDIASLTSGASSHSYEFRIYGPGIAEWTFNNILLPDSNVNESASHGFVKFKAKLLPNIAPGTIVTNSADIYFDYNEPVPTNEVWNTVFDTVFLAPVIISGAIITETNLPIPGVKVMLTGFARDSVVTAADGRYRFEVEREGNYTITVSKNNDLITAKGVTTYDVLTLRRHLLGMGDLPSPYKIIAAAEVNAEADTSVTTQDIVLIRWLILGNTTRFPGSRLWQFVSSDYIFTDTAHPFPFNKTRTYTNITSSQSNQNFIGIKLGDVNESWEE